MTMEWHRRKQVADKQKYGKPGFIYRNFLSIHPVRTSDLCQYSRTFFVALPANRPFGQHLIFGGSP
ncbi:MAG: hypothetical protein EPN75_08900 [Beijerinckiaceae bacterium]|nr:MAG: hypothetical protein EPN75_08900 [Beijerinckiaceae bacterium]